MEVDVDADVDVANDKSKPNVTRFVVSRDDEHRVEDVDETTLTHYAFRVSRETVYALQSELRNIVAHCFNDHSRNFSSIPLIDCTQYFLNRMRKLVRLEVRP
jgi:hypothetical protein